MKDFFINIFDKIVQNRAYALLVSLAIFIGIIVGIPYLISDKKIENEISKPTTTPNEGTTYIGDTIVSNEFDLSSTSENDLTETIEMEDSMLEDQIEEVAINDSYSQTDYQESYQTPAMQNPAGTDYSIIDTPVIEESSEEIIDPNIQIEIEESDIWEQSEYQYQDDTINVDFGDKDEDDNNSKVAYEAPVWEDVNGELFTTVSNWFDKITNRNLKSIEFALVDAYDSRFQSTPNIDLPISDFESSVWNDIKNFFVRIYQNDANNVILDKEDGQDIIINKSVLSNVNVKYQIIANRGIKEEIVVVNDSDVDNSYVFTLTLDEGVKYQRNTNYQVDAPRDVYYFSDSQNRYIAHFVPLVAYDMAGNTTENVSMTIVPLYDNNHKITITVDPEWMYDESRVFPIIIDPSIVHDNQPDFNTAKSLNRISTTSDPTIELDGPPYNSYGAYTSDVLDLGSSNPNLSTISWTENGVQTGGGETDLTTNGLVAAWNFNETSGTSAADASGNGINGTLINFADTSGQDVSPGSGWTASNKRWGNGSLMCDNSNDYVSLGNPSVIKDLNIGTVSAWVKSSSAGVVMSTGHSTNETQTPYFMLTNNGFYTHNGTTQNKLENTSAQDGKWHYLTWTSDGVTQKFYIDGVNQNLTAIVGSNNGSWFNDFSTNTMSLCILDRLTDYGPLNGTIDSVKVYDRVLSDNEIKSNSQITNIEFQTRTGSDTNPYDGGWEDWKPAGAGTETQIASMDSDASNWNWDNTINSNINHDSDDTNIKNEGTSSLKINSGIAKTDINTVGLWHLDETGGIGAFLLDETTNSNDGTPSGTTIIDGISSKARNFNGSSDYMSIPDDNSLDFGTGDFSMEIWLKPSSVSGNQTIISKLDTAGTWGDGWFLEQNGGTGIRFTVRSNTSDNAGVEANYAPGLNNNTWNHLVGVRNGSNIYLYLNGVQVASASGSPGNSDTSDNLLIGYEDWTSRYFSGIIDEVRLSNTALSSDEIYESFRLGRDHLINKSISSTNLSSSSKLPFYVASDHAGQTVDLTIGESAFANYQPDANTVGLWHFEETTGSGAYIKDSSSFNSHGTPTGTTSVSGKFGYSRSFNGSNNYVDATVNDTLQQATICAWIKTTQASLGQIYSQNNAGNTAHLSLYINNTGFTNKVSFGVWNGSTAPVVTSTSNVNTNEWVYVCGAKNGSNQSVYVNGILEATITNGNTPDIGNLVSIGRNRVPNTTFFNGAIDEVRIDNIARTPEEIRQAYEIGARTHSVIFDFAASLDNANTIAGSGDHSFTVDATTKGLSSKGEGLYVGDTIIIEENYNGTEYIAQGIVDSINTTTGATTVSNWIAGSTFPSGGYSQYSDAFKWQREYFDLTGIMDSHIDAVDQITIRNTDGSSGKSIWIDDIVSNTNYLTNPTGSLIQSSENQYIQYRAIFNTNNENVTPSISQVSINFDNAPDPSFDSTASSQSSLNTTNSTAFNVQCVGTDVFNSGDTVLCQGSWDNTNWHTIGSDTSPFTNTTIQGTPDVSSWTGYPSDGNVTMYVRLYIDSTAYSNKTLAVTKDILRPSISLVNSVAGDTSTPFIDSTNDGSTVVSYTASADASVCKWDETDTDYDSMTNTCSSTSSCTLDIAGSGEKTVYFRCLDSHDNKATSSYQLDYSISWSGYSKLIEFDRVTPEADYQVRIDLSSSNFTYSNAETNGEDIRFTDVENNPLSYWIQNWDTGGTSKVWVKVADADTKYIKMHYGDTGATSEEDGEAVFDFFDDFNDASLDGTKWDTYIKDTGPDPTITETGGNAVVYVPYSNDSRACLYSDQTFTKNNILEGRASINYANTYVKGEFGFDYSYPRPDYNSQISFLDDGGTDGNIYAHMRNMTSPVGVQSKSYNTSTAGGTNTWHDYKLVRDGNAVRWYLDDSLLYDYPENDNYVQQYYPVPQGNLPVAFGNYVQSDSTSETQYLDWVFVRKHNGDDLEATVNSEYSISSPDTTAPSVTSVTQVEGDTTNTWTDTGDNDVTNITINTPVDTAYCKWDTTDTDYDSMSGTCESTSACTVDSTSEATYNFYIRCMDFSGNKSASSFSLEVIVDYEWAYSRDVTISLATPQANYPVKIEFTSGTFDYSNTNSDGSDIRFTDTNNNMLDYWIQEWNDGGTSYVWVKVPTLGTSTIKVIYGNSYHIDRGDGSSVFSLFDDFSGSSLDTSLWNEHNGGVYNSYTSTISISNGLMDIYVPQVPYLYSGIESKDKYSYNYAIESRISADYGGNKTRGGVGFNDQRSDVEQLLLGDAISIEDNTGDTNIYSYTQRSGFGGTFGASTTGDINVWHNYKVTRPSSGSQPKFYLDNTLFATSTAAIPTINLPATISLASPSNAGAYPDSEEHTYVDWIFVRPFPSDDPLVTLGSEQSGQTTVPRVDTIISVAGDTASEYVDVSDNGSTLVVFTTLDSPTNVKWDIIDTDYDSMKGDCGSTTECDLTLAGEGIKTVYLRATDGTNKSISSYQFQYTIDITELSNTLQSSFPDEEDLTMTVSFVPSFSEPITDGSIKLVMADEFDFTGLTINDVTASGGDVTWSNNEQIYAGGSQIALIKPWFINIAKAQGENSITFNFTGDIDSSDGEITFTISGANLPGNPPTEGAYSYIIEWYEQNNAGGSPLYIQDGKVHINTGTTVTASVPTSFTFTINPVGSGSVNSATITTSTVTGTSTNFGTFSSSDDRIASHDLIVSTNSTNGYFITTQYTDTVQSAGGDIMNNFTGTNATPTTWSTPPGSGTESYFGYTTNDSSLFTNTTDRFTSSGGNKWAAFTTSPSEVAYSAIPTVDETTRVGYRLEITNLQPAGTYSTNVMYIATPTF